MENINGNNRNFSREMNALYDEWMQYNFNRNMNLINYFQDNLAGDYKRFQFFVEEQHTSINQLLASVCQLSSQLPYPETQLLKMLILEQSKKYETVMTDLLSSVNQFTAKSLSIIQSQESDATELDYE